MINVDASVARAEGFQLAKRLSVFDLIAIVLSGVGATIGAGVYILVGTVAKEQTAGSFSIMLCRTRMLLPIYKECILLFLLMCWRRVIFVAWLIGWSLILEYTLGGAAVPRGISPNMVVFFGVDPCAAVLVFIINGLFCTGIKEVSRLNGYFPYGANGVLAGSATVFFSYVGFDAVTSTAEEVKNPQRDLPIGIGVPAVFTLQQYTL
ncbi:hypothetical protein Lser_V15G01834 [Lactuca serriola]